MSGYGLSKAAQCRDFFVEVGMSAEEFLRGQRAVSGSQVAREGSHIRILSHERESLHKSYKCIYIDITRKLPSFARSVLPKFVILMEQHVQYPFNRSSLVCIKPRALEGASAFSETVFAPVGEQPLFTIEPPNDDEVTPIRVDPYKDWDEKSFIARPAFITHELLEGKKQPGRCWVHKRFLLDVGSENIVYRKLRSMMFEKFVIAFVDLVREVTVEVNRWSLSGPEGKSRPTFEDCFGGGRAPLIMSVWPLRNGAPVSRQAKEFVDSMKHLIDTEEGSEVGKVHVNGNAASTSTTNGIEAIRLLQRQVSGESGYETAASPRSLRHMGSFETAAISLQHQDSFEENFDVYVTEDEEEESFDEYETEQEEVEVASPKASSGRKTRFFTAHDAFVTAL